MKVLFLGNHTVGVMALKALIEKANVVGVVAHPQDPEDGVCYESVYDFAKESKIDVIRGRGNDLKVEQFIKSCQPDLLWVTDYRYLLPGRLLVIPAMGSVNLHPSLLPKYRGRAPVNWAIINGETIMGLTAHFITDGMDEGDIIEQCSFEVGSDQDVADVLEILLPLYNALTCEVVQRFIDGNVTSYAQENSLATIYPARKPEDGKISWHESACSIFNLVRAVTAPYPGAFTEKSGLKIYVWKADMCDLPESMCTTVTGTVFASNNDNFSVVCGIGALRVLSYSFEPTTSRQTVNDGDILS